MKEPIETIKARGHGEINDLKRGLECELERLAGGGESLRLERKQATRQFIVDVAKAEARTRARLEAPEPTRAEILEDLIGKARRKIEWLERRLIEWPAEAVSTGPHSRRGDLARARARLAQAEAELAPLARA